MTNYEIADQFSLFGKLMDIHGENSFKAKSYSVAAFNIERNPVQLSDLSREELFSQKGIGEAVGKKIIELLETGKIEALETIIENTPPGILEMMNIKGLGPKKINTIWKEMKIDTIGELLFACQENKLSKFKGFTKNTEETIIEAIKFYQARQGIFLYAQVEDTAKETGKLLQKMLGTKELAITGAFLRNEETIQELEYVVAVPEKKILSVFEKLDAFELLENNTAGILYQSDAAIKLRLFPTTEKDFLETLFYTSCTPEFKEEFKKSFPDVSFTGKEEAVFKKLGVQYLPPYLRDNPAMIEKAKRKQLPAVIEPDDIKGLIHSHSTWSDGDESIEAMARGAMDKGYEYLVISDHSKAAFYANGLSEERIVKQHQEIEALNKKLKPFKIFKSIESDILSDGSLDYSDDVLASFDLVIASVHSNLKMNEDKAMKRLLTAIENPYTIILGHMTGRQLLRRKGFPVDHRKIIDACAANHVVIELNANPNRLDMDYHHIEYALSKRVLISIDPDAHTIGEMDHNRHGVLMAQKGLLTKEHNLSSLGLSEFESYLKKVRKLKGI
jgi:DNA polymerase (family X)